MSSRPRPLVLLAALTLSVTASGCGGGDVDAAPTAVSATPPDTALLGAEAVRIAGLRIEPVRLEAWRDEWNGPARLALDPTVTQPLGSIVEGRVMRVLAQPGERVRAGQALVTLHSHEMLDALSARASAQAALIRAENEARLAESAAARAERLFAGKALSQAELEWARAAAVNAEALRFAALAESDRADEMVAHLTGDGPVPEGVSAHEVLIRSPMDGLVISRDVQPGQVVVVGAPLLTVSGATRLQLVLNLPEGALSTVTPGAEVLFSVQAYAGREWAATVTRVAPSIDRATRTVEVWADVNDPTDELRPEMFAAASVRGAAEGSALTVPAAAIQAMDGDTVLVVVEQRGEGVHVRAVPVRIGRRTARVAEVLSGVEEGAGIVVEGAAIARAEILRRREAGSEES